MRRSGDAAAFEAWRAFLEAHASVTARLDEELRRERGLPLTWYDVLISLERAGGRLRMQDLARDVLFSRSGLTRLVDRMEQARLVARAPCPDDRRGTFAVLTADGRRTLRRAAPVHLRGIARHFTAHLSAQERRTLTTALAKVARASRDGGGR
jgi:DNA-binding MarR family transcriptional regulator